MSKHECPICGGETKPAGTIDFSKTCEDRKEKVFVTTMGPIDYVKCKECDYCFSPLMCSWPPEKFSAEIYNEDYALADPEYESIRPTGGAEFLDNIFRDVKDRIKHLDYGGGNAVLSTILKFRGYDTKSYDPFVDKEPIVLDNSFDLVTCLEVFEHVPDPMALMDTLTGLIKSDGVILFSTMPSDNEIEDGKDFDWWYAAPRNGHISLYSTNTLDTLAGFYGLYYVRLNNVLHCMFADVPDWASGTLFEKEK